MKPWKEITLQHGVPTQWHWVVWHPEHLTMGKYVDIGAFSYLNAKHGIVIGDDVQIGSHCSIYSISTIDDKHGQVIIETGARIGSHSIIMPGVKIGLGAIIGAHSFVNKDVGAGKVVYGIPAKLRGDSLVRKTAS